MLRGNLHFWMGIHVIVQGCRATFLDTKAYNVWQKFSALTLWRILITVAYSGVIIVTLLLAEWVDMEAEKITHSEHVGA